MRSLTTKRIIVDLLELERNPIPNTHIWYDETDIKNIKLVIIGPDDTPYKGGFYIFDIQFSDNYPKNPPHVKFVTTNSYTRFNPNLYEDGKVCLSILNTWAGPKWSAIMSLSYIIINLQSILCKHPIRNEPGYETTRIKDSQNINYSKIIEFWNWKYAIIHVLNTKLEPTLNDYIQNYYKHNIDSYRKELLQYQKLYPIEISCIYNKHEMIDYNSILLPHTN